VLSPSASGRAASALASRGITPPAEAARIIINALIHPITSHLPASLIDIDRAGRSPAALVERLPAGKARPPQTDSVASLSCQGWRPMGRAAGLAPDERRRSARRADGQTGGVKDCRREDERGLRRRREYQKRLMDDAVEELLLELTQDAFSVLRIVRVRARAARIVYGGEARTVRRDGAVAVRRLNGRPVGDDEE